MVAVFWQGACSSTPHEGFTILIPHCSRMPVEIEQIYDGSLFGVVASNEKATHASLMKEFLLFWKVDVSTNEVAKPLEWWKENEARFLDVGSLAWQFITLLGSQIEIERAFNVTSFFTSLQWYIGWTHPIWILSSWSTKNGLWCTHRKSFMGRTLFTRISCNKSQPSWWQWRWDWRRLLE